MSISVTYPGITDQPTTLDALYPIRLTIEQTGHFSVEVYQLRKLAGGLNELYKLIKGVENEIRPKSVRRGFYFSVDIDEMLPIPAGLGECAFHWYAVSLSSYCDVVSTIGHEAGLCGTGTLLDTRRAYRDDVLGAVRTYRDKVAAHFARVSPKKENLVDLRTSILPQLSIVDDRLAVGGLKHAFGGAKTEVDLSWALTQVHENLCHRFPTLSTSMELPSYVERDPTVSFGVSQGAPDGPREQDIS